VPRGEDHSIILNNKYNTFKYHSRFYTQIYNWNCFD